MSPATVRSRDEAGHVTLTVEGSLDRVTGRSLVDTIGEEVLAGAARIDIDLSHVTSFAHDGAQALARCRDLCARLPAGLHYRTEGGAGQLALLAAFEREPVTDGAE